MDESVPAIKLEAGHPLLLGMHEAGGKFNFSILCRHATGVSLLLFDRDDPEPTHVIELSPEQHRTGDVWHIGLKGQLHGKGYAIRVKRPSDSTEPRDLGLGQFLLDPYAAAILNLHEYDHNPGPARPFAINLVVDHAFDWQGIRRPHQAWSDLIIYETHVRGLTNDPASGVRHPGQYLGLVEKIPYLRDLGITAVELLPIQEFRDYERWRPGVGWGPVLRNYWGYNPVAFFAPKAGYASNEDPRAAIIEFKTMVRELHRAGIEVILDVVFNHTPEGDETGPTISLRDLDPSTYYLLTPDTKRYVDVTGCGNTLNCNHPIVRTLIIDCLRYWVVHFHIDGFRFDLASVLTRDQDGALLHKPPLLEQIAEDPVLRDVKLIAEPWDAGGAFQVGSFPGQRWAEWNSRYRDDVRRFWRGDAGMAGAFATRLGGSADLYQSTGKTPLNSVNFVTCHDGFTLNDLVSYAHKHNQANGEDNRDGSTENFSENNGVEGRSDDPLVETVRLRQIKNMLVTLFVSRGVPMLLGGDEFRRSHSGNNNAYCQDNEISWYDWSLTERNAGLVRFVSRLIAFRKAHRVLGAGGFYTDREISWFGSEGRDPEWDGRENRIGCVIGESGHGAADATLCLLFNATSGPSRFALPGTAAPWRVAVDTSKPSPEDIAEPGEEAVLPAPGLVIVSPRSTVILVVG
ncbi:glycogen debranching enzyme GlgX (plasmid) [Microvirga ossetica]|uniref:Glycogen debranching enzyme GlgX n=1 Tax=Microvirga ossetica TaxID=1882682 RepID=A0A1B2EYE2_9HYPH|nr:glycogen debranching protein GlgX [Microvirga ossetica]ANY84995.1 glycogen debranching enzyme GlgX [Microvirga ossetica]